MQIELNSHVLFTQDSKYVKMHVVDSVEMSQKWGTQGAQLQHKTALSTESLSSNKVWNGEHVFSHATFIMQAILQCDHSGWLKLCVDLDLECSAILPGHYVATLGAQQLPEL